ncbi:MAG TPA: type II toxin-antitoxin system RelE/ParE family toxin [Chitinophagales bacterium]|jgi:toxin ParE1/3/4|nr:type II toxin-antitoxin system RelE/ParE family toxin [Chitinophagales bacterium]MBP6154349.1 type II toxin-antitoxin system RelE/ParE family toxin [Chitinophagales bacterium]HQW78354.1 type II toxin-antitoxin system RelE/ParE family toxin [Chitinophagales bacterium]
MMYKISNEAQNDIENIWLYTFENWSTAQADRYYNLILDEIENLAQNPEVGKDCSHIRKDYLRSKVKSHFIFYKINKKENTIEIIRVLHQQMDIENRLND